MTCRGRTAPPPDHGDLRLLQPVALALLVLVVHGQELLEPVQVHLQLVQALLQVLSRGPLGSGALLGFAGMAAMHITAVPRQPLTTRTVRNIRHHSGL